MHPKGLAAPVLASPLDPPLLLVADPLLPVVEPLLEVPPLLLPPLLDEVLLPLLEDPVELPPVATPDEEELVVVLFPDEEPFPEFPPLELVPDATALEGDGSPEEEHAAPRAATANHMATEARERIIQVERRLALPKRLTKCAQARHHAIHCPTLTFARASRLPDGESNR